MNYLLLRVIIYFGFNSFRELFYSTFGLFFIGILGLACFKEQPSIK